MAVIYQAENIANGKKYIGFAVDLKKRKREHLCEAITRKSRYVFHRAVRKYGPENFVWSVLMESKDGRFLLKDREEFFIRKLRTHYLYGNGYNMTYGGQGRMGVKFTNAQKEKMRESHLGYKMPMSQREAISRAHLGRIKSDIHRERLRQKSSRKWIVFLHCGGTVIIRDLLKFCNANGLMYTSMKKTANGTTKQHRGFKCKGPLSNCN